MLGKKVNLLSVTIEDVSHRIDNMNDDRVHIRNDIKDLGGMINGAILGFL